MRCRRIQWDGVVIGDVVVAVPACAAHMDRSGSFELAAHGGPVGQGRGEQLQQRGGDPGARVGSQAAGVYGQRVEERRDERAYAPVSRHLGRHRVLRERAVRVEQRPGDFQHQQLERVEAGDAAGQRAVVDGEVTGLQQRLASLLGDRDASLDSQVHQEVVLAGPADQ